MLTPYDCWDCFALDNVLVLRERCPGHDRGFAFVGKVRDFRYLVLEPWSKSPATRDITVKEWTVKARTILASLRIAQRKEFNLQQDAIYQDALHNLRTLIQRGQR